MVVYLLPKPVKSKNNPGCPLIHFCVLFNVSHRLHITFVDKDGIENNFEVAEGDNLLEIAHSNDLEMEGNNLIWVAKIYNILNHG